MQINCMRIKGLDEFQRLNEGIGVLPQRMNQQMFDNIGEKSLQKGLFLSFRIKCANQIAYRLIVLIYSNKAIFGFE